MWKLLKYSSQRARVSHPSEGKHCDQLPALMLPEAHACPHPLALTHSLSPALTHPLTRAHSQSHTRVFPGTPLGWMGAGPAAGMSLENL